MVEQSEYYSELSHGSLAARLSERARRRMFATFMATLAPAREQTLLDVGVTCQEGYALENYVEELYPFKDRITAVGLEDGSHLAAKFPGLHFQRIGAGPLPFEDRSFDFVHSSAVLEHVGSRQNQVNFLRELWRVSRCGIFVTTPNRWFPIEFHTTLPLAHWLPPATFRHILVAIGKEFYASEETLNLLSARALLLAARTAGICSPQLHRIGLMGWTTNLLLIARRPANSRYSVPDGADQQG